MSVLAVEITKCFLFPTLYSENAMAQNTFLHRRANIIAKQVFLSDLGMFLPYDC